MHVGAYYTGDGKCGFSVWAPFRERIAVKIVSPEEKIIPMEKDKRGYWKISTEGVYPDALYFYYLDGEIERPDPASHWQPQGVHGPSQVVDHNAFNWEDNNWRGIPLSEMIMYELHVGTFTPEGTFNAIIGRLQDIITLGINSIEIMPIAQFPGERNWGYDGAHLFAVQNSYGGPVGLKKLINECHKNEIAVILDVVYNHFGPEGNCLHDFGPYFTEKYRTPWGMAVNFDDAYSNEVRNFFIENALHWFKNYHIDALRLDAIHGISDMSARPFLQELADRVQEFSQTEGRKYYLIAESDLNDSKVTRPRELSGFGFDAQWCDDFHHSLHSLVTGEDSGYYADFGRTSHLKKSLKEGYVYSGQYSLYRKRNHGNSSKDLPASQFIVFSQNHDQIGNRMLGERLTSLVSFESLKLVAASVILSPFMPLLFMGEEYGENAPFLYFVSHSDADLVTAVREGRKKEFKAFGWKTEPPDPQGEETFEKSKIQWEKRKSGYHKTMLNFYKYLISLRRIEPALSHLDKDNLDVNGFEEEKLLTIHRWKDDSHVFFILNFDKYDRRLRVPVTEGEWEKILDSSDIRWGGPGSLFPDKIMAGDEATAKGESIVVYKKETPING
ncbi:MAG: malto-oligosyltrehalose trehalohydrolase [Nitrospirota bacterium]